MPKAPCVTEYAQWPWIKLNIFILKNDGLLFYIFHGPFLELMEESDFNFGPHFKHWWCNQVKTESVSIDQGSPWQQLNSMDWLIRPSVSLKSHDFMIKGQLIGHHYCFIIFSFTIHRLPDYHYQASLDQERRVDSKLNKN